MQNAETVQQPQIPVTVHYDRGGEHARGNQTLTIYPDGSMRDSLTDGFESADLEPVERIKNLAKYHGLRAEFFEAAHGRATTTARDRERMRAFLLTGTLPFDWPEDAFGTRPQCDGDDPASLRRWLASCLDALSARAAEHRRQQQRYESALEVIEPPPPAPVETETQKAARLEQERRDAEADFAWQRRLGDVERELNGALAELPESADAKRLRESLANNPTPWAKKHLGIE